MDPLTATAAAILGGLMTSPYYRDNPEGAYTLAWTHAKGLLAARPADAPLPVATTTRTRKRS